MSSEKPLLVVCGATGTQGGSVISHFLSKSPCPYNIRGLTRNPSSPKSVALSSRGVEMVAADFADPSSLNAAFAGALYIYGTNDFWVFYDDPASKEKAKAAGRSLMVLSKENDTFENKNIIDAAAKVSTLQRLVMSSQAYTEKVSGGKISHCYHFDGKAIAEEYLRSDHPKLWEKTNVIFCGFYLENLVRAVGEMMRPKLTEEGLALYMDDAVASAPFPYYSAVNDTGPLVEALIRAPPSNRVIGVNEWLNLKDLALLIGEVMGKKVKFMNENPVFDMGGDEERMQDNLEMLMFGVEFGYDGGKVDKTVVKPTELGVPLALRSVKDWVKDQDWASVYGIKDSLTN
ncbi:unnamed protein product [Clonostachys rosea]|uniref:NmrA-like domain-containing protein n=1 Tax=Bionectria ochroleuca TaxID=29856 RepID=A0ABY6ULU2_BIOOC|nr:unnamed protein product [Clonostachys rosea]